MSFNSKENRIDEPHYEKCSKDSTIDCTFYTKPEDCVFKDTKLCGKIHEIRQGVYNHYLGDKESYEDGYFLLATLLYLSDGEDE